LPLSSSARRAALMHELSAASEMMRPRQMVSINSSLLTIRSLNEQVEHLRLDVDSLAGAPQLLPRSVDLETPEAKIQNIPHPQSWFHRGTARRCGARVRQFARNMSGPGLGLRPYGGR
jgi:hypothetical protein